MAPGATIIQRPATLIRGVNQQGFSVHPGVIPTSQPFGMTSVPTSLAAGPVCSQSPVILPANANLIKSSQSSQMTPQDALTKGFNFLNQLLTKMHIKKKKEVLQNLIQALIDGRKSPGEFTSALQRELNSEPQTQLVPFLTLMLPHLRQSMNAGHTKLPGITPPGPVPQPPTILHQPTEHLHQPVLIPSTSSTIKDGQSLNNGIMTNNVVVSSHMQPSTTTMSGPFVPLSAASSAGLPTIVRPAIGQPTVVQPPFGQPTAGQSTVSQPLVGQSVVGQPMVGQLVANQSTNGQVGGAPPPPKKKKVPLPPGVKSAYAIKKEAREARKREKELAAQGIKLEKGDGQDETDSKTDKPTPKSKPDRSKQPKQKKSDKQLESLSATLRDDDDVNDVAAMGGVNLAEESQKIMASGAELVGTQIRSCKDEAFFDLNSLSAKISRIVKRYDLSEPSNDVVTLISHATQERLKDLVERLGVLAEHRSENLRSNPKYEISNDIKGKMKFLAELDRIEKRRYEEQERELLLRVAKSRSKVEDPEQQKLRQKAKDMQRAEQEEVRQREANQTALLAIGPRKKLKTDTASTMSSLSQSSMFKDTKIGDFRSEAVRRIKRVSMRDLQVLLELDRMYLDRLIKTLC